MSETAADPSILYFRCTELPGPKGTSRRPSNVEAVLGSGRAGYDEQTPLLDGAAENGNASFLEDSTTLDGSPTESLEAAFAGLNALEIAAVAGAKKFLGQKSIQRIINGIWQGDIVFWDSLSTHSTKKARIYNRHRSDPYCRLRVPMYLRVFEVVFFVSLLAFYYAVLIPDQESTFTAAEVLLYVWLLAFSYNELGEFWDAGLTFYVTDFWSSWDLGIIATGLAAFISRCVGVFGENEQATNTAFDILSVQALFLVPRSVIF
jgi:hypothetical protein